MADDWRAAVRAAGALLVEACDCPPAYTDAMIATVKAHGPYIVITPGFALPHAGLWELLAGGTLEPGSTVHGYHRAPLAPAVVALSKPGPEYLPGTAREHILQTRWPCLVA